jgi:3-oxoacyl-[acyl-carrier protein] reductase
MKKIHYFEGKTILITGGSSGIGYALAERIASLNPRAIILLSHEENKLLAAENKLREAHAEIHIGSLVADIADSTAVKNACSNLISNFGVPDIVINNAGYAHYLLFHEMSEDEIIRHVDVNLIGAMRVVHALLPAMRAAKRGQIVNVSSIAGHMIITPNLAYCAAKHGMIAWSEGLAAELQADGISVQTISPGRVLTDFFRHESFQKRVSGAETRLTVPLSKVVDVSINAIIKQKKMVIVPNYWLLIAWAMRVCPFILKPMYFGLIRKRVNRLKTHSE